MRVAKHTPGPWSVSDINGIEANDSGFSVVMFRHPHDDDDSAGVFGRTEAEETANARLIAAAPDLLEALAAIASMAGDGRRTASLPAIGRLASEAIAKATEVSS